MLNSLKPLFAQLKITPNKPALYLEALTHNSYKHEKNINYTYQRLEFLGDAIINKLISCYLFANTALDEEQMTDIRKHLVSTDTLQKAAEDLKLLDYVFLGKGVNRKQDTQRIKADVFEALIGALYLDQGEKAALVLLQQTIIKYYCEGSLADTIDYKTKIQEWFQRGKDVFYYQTKPFEQNQFVATLFFQNQIFGIGYGTSKKKAEKAAAKQAYQRCIGVKSG